MNNNFNKTDKNDNIKINLNNFEVTIISQEVKY